MELSHLDHWVLTVRDIEATCTFYHQVLGMTPVTFGRNRHALVFGNHKINLHTAGQEFEPKAAVPTPGSADLCLITPWPLDTVMAHLAAQNIPLVEGPVRRTGARNALESVYIRDPDGNLIEIAQEILP